MQRGRPTFGQVHAHAHAPPLAVKNKGLEPATVRPILNFANG